MKLLLFYIFLLINSHIFPETLAPGVLKAIILGYFTFVAICLTHGFLGL